MEPLILVIFSGNDISLILVEPDKKVPEIDSLSYVAPDKSSTSTVGILTST
jgi:hypothetical protein